MQIVKGFFFFPYLGCLFTKGTMVSFAEWVNAFLKVIVNAIVSLISFLACLHMEGNFYALILYPATLMKVFIICSFLVEPLRSFKHRIISFSNKDTLASPFPILSTLSHPLVLCSSQDLKAQYWTETER